MITTLVQHCSLLAVKGKKSESGGRQAGCTFPFRVNGEASFKIIQSLLKTVLLSPEGTRVKDKSLLEMTWAIPLTFRIHVRCSLFSLKLNLKSNFY